MQIETQRLILRKPEVSDVDDYMEFVNSEFVLRYNAMNPIAREQAERHFSSVTDDFSTVAIELKKTGKVIGVIFSGEDSLRYRVSSKEISYFLREEETGYGYMREALKTYLAHLFEAEKLTCVTARCFAPNVASRKLLEHLGFQQEGFLRKCVKGYNDVVFDDCLFSLMKEEMQ